MMDSRNAYSIGDRCRVMCTGFGKPWEVRGCIVNVEKTTPTAFNVVVATDTPHNNLPKEKEINFAKALGMSDNGQSIFTIASILIGSKITIKKLPNDPLCESPPNAIFMCNSHHCNSLRQHQHMLMTCPNLHVLCANHLVPWNKQNMCVDDICCRDFLKLVKKYMSKNRLSDEFLSTRALLGYSNFVRATSELEAEKAVVAAATCPTWECQRCREDMAYHKKEPVKVPYFGINQLHAQLNGLEFDINEVVDLDKYGVTSKGSPDTAAEIDPDSALLNMNVDVMDTLLERGVSVANLEAAINQVELDEVEHLSVDDVLFLLDVYKQNRKGKKPKERTESSHTREPSKESLSFSNISNKRSSDTDNSIMSRPVMSRQSSMGPMSSPRSPKGFVGGRSVARHASMGNIGSSGKNAILNSFDQWDENEVSKSFDSFDSKPWKAVTIHIPHNMGKYDVRINIALSMDKLMDNIVSQLSEIKEGAAVLDTLNWADLRLYFIDPKTSWATEIINMGATVNDYKNGFVMKSMGLQDNDLLALRSCKDIVRAKQCLPTLNMKGSIKNNELLRHKIDLMMTRYSSWRAVKGDGNCYYRAVYFSLFEQLLLEHKVGIILKIKKLFEKLTFPNAIDRLNHADLLKYFEKFQKDQAWRSAEEFEADVLNPETGVDWGMIKATRRLVTEYILKNRNRSISSLNDQSGSLSNIEANQMTIKEVTLSLYDDVSSIEEYCAKYVDKMGIDAEGPFVNIGLLLLALNCKGCIIYLDNREDVELTMIESGVLATSVYDGDAHGNVHLLLRPGHYDMLYPKVRKMSGSNGSVASGNTKDDVWKSNGSVCSGSGALSDGNEVGSDCDSRLKRRMAARIGGDARPTIKRVISKRRTSLGEDIDESLPTPPASTKTNVITYDSLSKEQKDMFQLLEHCCTGIKTDILLSLAAKYDTIDVALKAYYSGNYDTCHVASSPVDVVTAAEIGKKRIISPTAKVGSRTGIASLPEPESVTTPEPTDGIASDDVVNDVPAQPPAPSVGGAPKRKVQVFTFGSDEVQAASSPDIVLPEDKIPSRANPLKSPTSASDPARKRTESSPSASSSNMTSPNSSMTREQALKLQASKVKGEDMLERVTGIPKKSGADKTTKEIEMDGSNTKSGGIRSLLAAAKAAKKMVARYRDKDKKIRVVTPDAVVYTASQEGVSRTNELVNDTDKSTKESDKKTADEVGNVSGSDKVPSSKHSSIMSNTDTASSKDSSRTNASVESLPKKVSLAAEEVVIRPGTTIVAELSFSEENSPKHISGVSPAVSTAEEAEPMGKSVAPLSAKASSSPQVSVKSDPGGMSPSTIASPPAASTPDGDNDDDIDAEMLHKYALKLRKKMFKLGAVLPELGQYEYLVLKSRNVNDAVELYYNLMASKGSIPLRKLKSTPESKKNPNVESSPTIAFSPVLNTSVNSTTKSASVSALMVITDPENLSSASTSTPDTGIGTGAASCSSNFSPVAENLMPALISPGHCASVASDDGVDIMDEYFRDVGDEFPDSDDDDLELTQEQMVERLMGKLAETGMTAGEAFLLSEKYKTVNKALAAFEKMQKKIKFKKPPALVVSPSIISENNDNGASNTGGLFSSNVSLNSSPAVSSIPSAANSEHASPNPYGGTNVFSAYPANYSSPATVTASSNAIAATSAPSISPPPPQAVNVTSPPSVPPTTALVSATPVQPLSITVPSEDVICVVATPVGANNIPSATAQAVRAERVPRRSSQATSLGSSTRPPRSARDPNGSSGSNVARLRAARSASNRGAGSSGLTRQHSSSLNSAAMSSASRSATVPAPLARQASAPGAIMRQRSLRPSLTVDTNLAAEQGLPSPADRPSTRTARATRQSAAAFAQQLQQQHFQQQEAQRQLDQQHLLVQHQIHAQQQLQSQQYGAMYSEASHGLTYADANAAYAPDPNSTLLVDRNTAYQEQHLLLHAGSGDAEDPKRKKKGIKSRIKDAFR